MMLAWVGGSKVGVERGDLGSSTDQTDHGLLGASVEKAQADSLPAGKPIRGATEAPEFETENENEDDSEPIATPHARTLVATLRPAGQTVDEADAVSAMCARLLLASIGARGPPLG